MLKVGTKVYHKKSQQNGVIRDAWKAPIVHPVLHKTDDLPDGYRIETEDGVSHICIEDDFEVVAENASKIRNCSECPFFEWFLEEYEEGFGMVGKGRCHKYDQDEIWETKASCPYAENRTREELEKEAFN